MGKSEVFEKIISIYYKTMHIRCWIPIENINNIKSLEEIVPKIENFLENSNLRGYNYAQIAKKIANKFKMNACQVGHSILEDGVVYYSEWP